MTEPTSLPPASENRLARFAAAFERLDAGTYATLATDASGDPEIERAMAAADAVIGQGPWRATVRTAVDRFRDWAARAYSSRLVQTDTVFLFQSLADRPDDRVRFAASLERAVIAVVLWDELDLDARDALLGPWQAIAERAVGP